MQRRAVLTTLGAGLVSGTPLAQPSPVAPDPGKIVVTRDGSQPSSWGPEEYFTGLVRIDPLFKVTPPSRTSGMTVTFEPGSRTLWHSHPLGQTLIVGAGLGWLQRWGEATDEIRPGDVVWIPPGVKHWHGATPETQLTHIALQDHLDGRSVSLLEEVSDAQYRR